MHYYLFERIGSNCSSQGSLCCLGECVVIIPIPQRLCAIDPWQWHGEQSAAQRDVHVRLEVTADNLHYDSLVSAIIRIARVGKIDLASRHGSMHRHTG